MDSTAGGDEDADLSILLAHLLAGTAPEERARGTEDAGVEEEDIPSQQMHAVRAKLDSTWTEAEHLTGSGQHVQANIAWQVKLTCQFEHAHNCVCLCDSWRRADMRGTALCFARPCSRNGSAHEERKTKTVPSPACIGTGIWPRSCGSAERGDVETQTSGYKKDR